MSIVVERRFAERKRVYLSGEIVSHADRAAVTDCAVRSISDTGACIDAPAAAPLIFDLRLVRDGTVRRARTVWRQGDRRAVAFSDDANHAPQTRPKTSIFELRRSLRLVTK